MNNAVASRNVLPSGTPALPLEPADPPDFSVVIPCHNEAPSIENLRQGLLRLRAALDGLAQLEILLVDDGSTDDTHAILWHMFGQQDDVTILRHAKNLGIAAALATGVRHARAEVVASLDADCTYDPLELVYMLPLLSEEVDLVLASPYHPSGAVHGCSAWRLALSRMASRCYRTLLRNKLHTYTSCVRIYRRSSVVGLDLRNHGFVGVTELVWQVDRRGGKIVEHPAALRVRQTGQSKMRIVRTTWGHLRLLARAALLRLCGVRVEPLRKTGLLTSPLVLTLNETLSLSA